MASRTHQATTVPWKWGADELTRLTALKGVCVIKQVSEDSMISFQSGPNSSGKVTRLDWAIGAQAIKVAESKEHLRRRLVQKLLKKQSTQ